MKKLRKEEGGKSRRRRVSLVKEEGRRERGEKEEGKKKRHPEKMQVIQEMDIETCIC